MLSSETALLNLYGAKSVGDRKVRSLECLLSYGHAENVYEGVLYGKIGFSVVALSRLVRNGVDLS